MYGDKRYEMYGDKKQVADAATDDIPGCALR
jgi:hypothetical protein